MSAAESRRIDALLERFALTQHRSEILALASPCISLALIDPPSVPEPDLPRVAIGASKVGGEPDLPTDAAWPANEQGRAGFFLQIALGDLPVAPWNPLPAQGMFYLFCHDDSRAYRDPPGWEVVWWRGEPAGLRRITRELAPLNSWVGESSFFTESVARPLAFRAGTDFPPGSSGDWDFINDFERRTRASDPGALDRYFEFRLHAADPGAEQDSARGRGPYFHPIGRLLGHTDLSLIKDDARSEASCRQFLRLESNPATRYMSPFDAAPVFLMARDAGVRPWAPSGGIIGLAAK